MCANGQFIAGTRGSLQLQIKTVGKTVRPLGGQLFSKMGIPIDQGMTDFTVSATRQHDQTILQAHDIRSWYQPMLVTVCKGSGNQLQEIAIALEIHGQQQGAHHLVRC